MSPAAYPIEVEFPDIGVHAEGNTGIAHVHSFDSGAPGPHVMVNALTHGNEVCGAIVVDALLRADLRPRRGRLTLAFANVAAYARFDPAQPDRARFVDQDFNRVWTAALLDDLTRRSSELDRARAMRPVIDTVDLLPAFDAREKRPADRGRAARQGHRTGRPARRAGHGDRRRRPS